MNKCEALYDNVSLQVGMIIQRSYFRYTLNTRVSVYKSFTSALLYFKLIDFPDQRLEVHPNSVQEIIQLEGIPIYYLILQKRPSLSRKEGVRDF